VRLDWFFEGAITLGAVSSYLATDAILAPLMCCGLAAFWGRLDQGCGGEAVLGERVLGRTGVRTISVVRLLTVFRKLDIRSSYIARAGIRGGAGMSSAQLGTLALCLVWAVTGQDVYRIGQYQLGEGGNDAGGSSSFAGCRRHPEISTGEDQQGDRLRRLGPGNSRRRLVSFDARFLTPRRTQTSAAVSRY